MNENEYSKKTRKLLIEHYKRYPLLKAEDIFKYLFHSAFGCDHLVSDEAAALDYIEREYGALPKSEAPLIEELDGEYSRISLSHLKGGLAPKTLARIFCLSAKKETDGKLALEEKLRVAEELVASGELPFDKAAFNKSLDRWKGMGYPAIHHSNEFRKEYHPAYRVIANRYSSLLPLFTEIDKRSLKECLIVAIEGGSAGGKTTLAKTLKQVYDCNVFHTDDFFLRPEQRTPERLAQIGGNIDRERFEEEILFSLQRRETVKYSPFDCSVQKLSPSITVNPKRITIVEGVYSMHPAFGKYYDFSVFLDISPEYQKKRIFLRNTPAMASRFFEEWIPLENRYFSANGIKERADLVLPVYDS